MRINAHTHIFTLKNVLSKEAVRALGNRLRHKKVPGHLVNGIENFIVDLSNRPRYLDEGQLLEQFIHFITETNAFKSFAADHLSDIRVLNLIRVDGKKLSQAALKELLNGLSAWGEANDDSESSLFDIYETLRIALMPHATSIGDHLLEHLDKRDALIALMMDIRGDSESERDRLRFLQQIDDLSEASLQRPGRIFPFFAVNPKRENHFDLMKKAVEERGFPGVKLYPSLGYPVQHPDLMKVYAYCEENEIPLMMHCNKGGFYVEEAFIDYCNPVHWEPILEDYPNLTLCFAHFGGHETLSSPNGLDGDTWGKKILELLDHDRFPNLYTDISYHADMMSDQELEERYLTNLRSLLERPLVQDKILFGTDSWMLRLNMSDELFWSFFSEKLSDEHFERIASVNPKRYLGITPRRKNMERYAGYISLNRKSVGSSPAPWLAEVIPQEFTVTREHPLWTLQKYPAHVVLISIGSQMLSRQKNLAFSKKAFITMQELKFWNLSHADEDAFKQECKKLSLDLVNQCEKTALKREGNWSKNDARQTFESMISKGSTRFLDLAIQADAIYHFKTE